MIEDVSLRLSVERGVGASAGRATLISGSGSELVCTCSKAQYDLLMGVVSRNLAGGGDAASAPPPAAGVEEASTERAAAADSAAAALPQPPSQEETPAPPAAAAVVRRLDLVLPAVELALEDGGGPLLLAWMGGVRIGARQSADSAVYSVSSAALAVQDCRGGGYPAGRGTRPADSTGSRLKRLLWSDPAAEPAAASSAQLSVSHSVERLPGRGHEATTVVSVCGARGTHAAGRLVCEQLHS